MTKIWNDLNMLRGYFQVISHGEKEARAISNGNNDQIKARDDHS